MDEFMSGAFDSSSSESDKKVQHTVKKASKNKKNKSKKNAKQKKSLKERLKEQDPEFLEFLQDEDEALLDMDDADISDEDNYEDDGEGAKDVGSDFYDDDDDDIELPESSDEDTETPPKKLKTKKKKEKNKESKKPKENTKTGKLEIHQKNKEKEVHVAKKSSKKDTSKGTMSQKNKDTDDVVEEDIKFEDFDMGESDSDEEGNIHKPPDKLEEMSASDSDDDMNDEPRKKSSRGVKVTISMIKDWTRRFKELPSPALIHEAVYAFKAAVQQTATESVSTKYKVVGSKVFNAVVRMCLVEIPQALNRVLDLPVLTDLQKPVLPSSKNQKWKKVRLDMKSYLADILQLLSSLSQANMVDVLMKHIHKLVAFYACFPKLTKTMLKKVIVVWSTSEETSRVLAFLCINRLIRLQQNTMLETCLKQMYMAYVKNCKFTSPNSLPLINFMQKSMVEVMSLDFALAYQYAFIYIRQLAIHLRNAISTKKKESCQAVYNWQFVHCLGLWVQLLSMTHPNDVLEPLIYPLTQTIIGTIKLVPTQRYYPLRFHCVRDLTMLSKATGTYIPVLPFLLEVFEQTDFNKKHKAISFKPINFSCVLKLSKVQLQERSFKDGVVDQLFELLLEHFNVHAHTIGFPELALPTVLQLKDFLKKCKVSNFTRQIKQIVEKVDENCKYINNRRRAATLSLSDTKAIESWERQCQESGTPLGKFYTTWRKLRDRELLHQISQKDQIVGEDRLPEIIKPRVPEKATDEEKKEFAALFDTDSEDEEDLTKRVLSAKEKKKKKTKAKGKEEKTDESGSEYSDFDSDDLEQLAGSGDDDSSTENSEELDISDADSDEVEDSGEEEDDLDIKEEKDKDDLEEKDIVKDFSLSSDEEN